MLLSNNKYYILCLHILLSSTKVITHILDSIPFHIFRNSELLYWLSKICAKDLGNITTKISLGQGSHRIMNDPKPFKSPEDTQWTVKVNTMVHILGGIKRWFWFGKASTDQKRKKVRKKNNSNILICSNPFAAPDPPLFHAVFSITNTTLVGENILKYES